MRNSGNRALAPVLLFCLFSALPASAQQAQPADASGTVPSQYLELPHVPVAQLDSADLSLIHGKQHEIAGEAAFFGYNLASGEWNADATSCPALPEQFILHYRRQYPNGAASLFTALVPRGSGRVYVVPVLYRNATPFRSATGSERSIAVFNRVVPADVAVKAMQPEGKWLAYGLCYADIVYGNANALQHAGTEIGLAQAPLPLLRLSEVTRLRGIVFTDRNAPSEYLVWNLTLNDKGRLVAAAAQQLSDYVAQVRTGAEPAEKPMPQGKEPPVKTLPAGQEPKVVPRPQ